MHESSDFPTWADDIYKLFCSNSDDPLALIAEAGLDLATDLCYLDLSGIILDGLDFGHSNLSGALFVNASVAGTNFSNSKMDFRNLLRARNWEHAIVNASAQLEINNLLGRILALDIGEIEIANRPLKKVNIQNIRHWILDSSGYLATRPEPDVKRAEKDIASYVSKNFPIQWDIGLLQNFAARKFVDIKGLSREEAPMIKSTSSPVARRLSPVDIRVSKFSGGVPNFHIVGNDLISSVSLVMKGDLLLDGKLTGDVKVNRLIIGEQGLVEGNVFADEVFVRGKTKGKITANIIHLEETANVGSDLIQDQLLIANGAFFDGKCARKTSTPQLKKGLFKKI